MKYCKRRITRVYLIIVMELEKTSAMHNAKKVAFNEINKEKIKTD